MEEKNLNIVVDEGSVKVPICNKFGDEIGVFYFNPTDMGIMDRYTKAMAEFDKITEPLQNVNIKFDDTVDETHDAELEAMREAQRRLYETCDYLFGGNMSEAFFGKVHPFSPVNGRFYCENALEAVGEFISKQLSREVGAVGARVQKYTSGYQNGESEQK